MRNSILTIDDLVWAKENAPDLVEECFKEVAILDDLEEYMAWLSESETTTIITTELKRFKQRSLGIHPSSACKKNVCLLKLFYECTGKITPKRAYDPVMQRTWDIGTLLHDVYQAHLKNMYGDAFEDEVSLRDKKTPHQKPYGRSLHLSKGSNRPGGKVHQRGWELRLGEGAEEANGGQRPTGLLLHEVI